MFQQPNSSFSTFKIDSFCPEIQNFVTGNSNKALSVFGRRVGIIAPPGSGKTLRLPILLSQTMQMGVFVVVPAKDKDTVEQSLACLEQNGLSRQGITVLSDEDVKVGLFEGTINFKSNDIVILDDVQNGSSLTEAIYNLWSVFEIPSKLILVGTGIDTTVFQVPIYKITFPSHPISLIYSSQNHLSTDPTLIGRTIQILQDWLFSSSTGNVCILAPTELIAKHIRIQVEELLEQFPQVQAQVQLNATCSTGSHSGQQIYILSSPKGQRFSNVEFLIDMMYKESLSTTPLGGVRTRIVSISKNEATIRAESVLVQNKIRTCFRLCTKEFYDALPSSNTGNFQPPERLCYECVLAGIPVLDVYPRFNKDKTTLTVKRLIELGLVQDHNSTFSTLALKLSLPFKMTKILWNWVMVDRGDAFLMLSVLQLIDSFETTIFKPAPALFNSNGENEMYYFQHFKQFFGGFTGSSTLSTLVGLWRIFVEEVGLVEQETDSNDEKVRVWSRMHSIDENVFIQIVHDFWKSWRIVREVFSNVTNEITSKSVLGVSPEFLTDDFVNESIAPRLVEAYPERVIVRQKSDLTRVLYTRDNTIFSLDTETVPVSEQGIAFFPYYVNLIQRTIFLPGDTTKQVVLGVGVDELPNMGELSGSVLNSSNDVASLVEGKMVF